MKYILFLLSVLASSFAYSSDCSGDVEECSQNGLIWNAHDVKLDFSNRYLIGFTKFETVLNCTAGNYSTYCDDSSWRLPTFRELVKMMNYANQENYSAFSGKAPRFWFGDQGKSEDALEVSYKVIDEDGGLGAKKTLNISTDDPYLITSTVMNLDQDNTDGKYQVMSVRLKTGATVPLTNDSDGSFLFCKTLDENKNCITESMGENQPVFAVFVKPI